MGHRKGPGRHSELFCKDKLPRFVWPGLGELRTGRSSERARQLWEIAEQKAQTNLRRGYWKRFGQIF
jgi:hypothetical protein